MALGAILVVAIAVLGSLTVLPATLALLGDKVDRGRVSGVVGARRGRASEPGACGAASRVGSPPAHGCRWRSRWCCWPDWRRRSCRCTPPTRGSGTRPQNAPIRVAQRAIDAAFPGANDTAQLVVSGHRLGTAQTPEHSCSGSASPGSG